MSGILTHEQLEEARNKERIRQERRAARKQPQQTQQSQPQSEEQVKQEPEPMSLKDKLAKLKQDNVSTKAVQMVLSEAQELQADQENVKLFVNLVDQFEQMETYNLLLVMSTSDAAQKVERLSWKERLKLLEESSQEDSSVQNLVESLRGFDQNIPLRELLFRVYARFCKPLKDICEMEKLRLFLEQATEEGLTDCVSNVTHNFDEWVSIPTGDRKVSYRPKMKMSVAKAGWVFVKEAHARAKKDWDTIDDLSGKATQGLTPYRISKGDLGRLFVPLGPAKGILLESRILDNRTYVCMATLNGEPCYVGLNAKEVPCDSDQLWDSYNHCLKDLRDAPLSDAWKNISDAIASLNQQQKARSEERHRQKQEQTAPLMNFPNVIKDYFRFEDQGLIRVLEGEAGCIPVANPRFIWGYDDKSGFFGITVERRSDGKFYLMAAVSDFRFDKDIIGEELTITVNFEEGKLWMEIPKMAKERFVSLLMVQKILQGRFKQELRYCEAPASEETSSNQS